MGLLLIRYLLEKLLDSNWQFLTFFFFFFLIPALFFHDHFHGGRRWPLKVEYQEHLRHRCCNHVNSLLSQTPDLNIPSHSFYLIRSLVFVVFPSITCLTYGTQTCIRTNQCFQISIYFRRGGRWAMKSIQLTYLGWFKFSSSIKLKKSLTLVGCYIFAPTWTCMLSLVASVSVMAITLSSGNFN